MTSISVRARRAALPLASAAALIAASPALAQAAAPQDEPAEVQSEAEIVVTGTFLDQGSKSAMKMDVPVLDTPFSVSSYSDEFVKSLESSNVTDLYNYMTGVKKAGNTSYDISMRGFKSGGDDRNAIMVDGLPGLTARYASPPTIGVERIEVVKGPMSVLYGAIQPGGFVNIVSKKPQARRATLFEARGTTYWGGRLNPFDRSGFNLALDTTGAFDADAALLYRLVAEVVDKNQFRDFTYERGVYVAPSLTWAPGAGTSITLLGEYRKGKGSFDTGLVAPNGDIKLVAPITTRYQEPDSLRREEGFAATLLLKQEIAPGWSLNTSARLAQNKSNQQEYSATAVVLRTSGYKVSRRARELKQTRHYRYVDANVTGDFDTGGIEHKLLLGVNVGTDDNQINRIKFFNSNNPNGAGVCAVGNYCLEIDVYNPIYGRVPSVASLPATNPTLANQSTALTNKVASSDVYSAYISDLISLTQSLKVFVAARTFKESQTIEELNVPNIPVQKKDAKRTLLPSAGILFQPSKQVTIYGSYAESFTPADPGLLDINGLNPFLPTQGRQYEVGIKSEKLLNGKFDATISLYHIEQTNVLSSFTCPLGTCWAQVGGARSEGAEVEFNLEPNPDWTILLGYSHINARITRSLDAVQVGTALPNTAKNAVNMWTRYDLTDKFGVGLGMIYTGARQGVTPTAAAPIPLLLPSYFVTDAGIYFKSGNISATLKVGNILNEKYYESAGLTGRIQIAPGVPRNLTASLRFEF